MVFMQRFFKSLTALSMGLLGILVASGNILDYDTNWQFVHHVLSMDTMEPWFNGQAIRSRAVTSLAWQQAAYISIITGEMIFGILCIFGGMLMLYGTLKGKESDLIRGKTIFIAGCIPALLVWFTGFVVIGGEYFAMWANKWSGQMKAYTFITFIMLSLFYISQPETKN